MREHSVWSNKSRASDISIEMHAAEREAWCDQGGSMVGFALLALAFGAPDLPLTLAVAAFAGVDDLVAAEIQMRLQQSARTPNREAHDQGAWHHAQIAIESARACFV